jgi:hypothetical protein
VGILFELKYGRVKARSCLSDEESLSTNLEVCKMPHNYPSRLALFTIPLPLFKINKAHGLRASVERVSVNCFRAALTVIQFDVFRVEIRLMSIVV